jgi:hypothetical protein
MFRIFVADVRGLDSQPSNDQASSRFTLSHKMVKGKAHGLYRTIDATFSSLGKIAAD